jgi:Flp pilus assembly protein TadD
LTAGACGLQHKAFLALAAGKFAAAVELFREALNLEPTNLAFATNMALSELYNGQLLKAVETLESVSPSVASARVPSARILPDVRWESSPLLVG